MCTKHTPDMVYSTYIYESVNHASRPGSCHSRFTQNPYRDSQTRGVESFEVHLSVCETSSHNETRRNRCRVVCSLLSFHMKPLSSAKEGGVLLAQIFYLGMG